MKKLIIVLSVFLFSCNGESDHQTTIQTSNNKYELHLLFEAEGCKVYRFSDCGRDLYYTTCEGVVSYDRTYRTGKTTNTEHISIPTTKN